MTLRIGALISGGGRTVINLAEVIRREKLPADIAVVIAHREHLLGVTRCRQAGLPVRVLDMPDRTSLAEAIDDALVAAGVELVVLAGYLRSFRVAPRWIGRTINIHPSLLPAFGGKGMFGDRVHAAVLAAGVTTSGCTVHAVDEEYDRGPILLQRTCAVEPGDTAETLAGRVFVEERIALPEVIGHIARREWPLPLVMR